MTAKDAYTGQSTGTLTPEGGLALLVGAVSMAGVASPAPSLGYEPLLIAKGMPTLIARFMAATIVKSGRRVAADYARETVVMKSLRDLRKDKVGRLVRKRRISTLLRANDATHILETIFDEAKLDVGLFVQLLVACREGDFSHYSHVAHMARIAVARWQPRRGPKVTEASAAHKFLLEKVALNFGPRRAYTQDIDTGKFVDEFTKATRLEFNDDKFNPQSSRRRIIRGPQPFEPR